MKNTAKNGNSQKKFVYRIKLELDFLVGIDEENKQIHRALNISTAQADSVLENIKLGSNKEALAEEFKFFSKEGFDSIKQSIDLLHLELLFNQIGKTSEREKFIKASLKTYEKLLRKKLRGKRGRPKTDYSFHELFHSDEVEIFVLKIHGNIQKLKKQGYKITKKLVAEKLFPNNSNASQTLNRKLKEYKFTFEDILNQRPIHLDLLANFLAKSAKK